MEPAHALPVCTGLRAVHAIPAPIGFHYWGTGNIISILHGVNSGEGDPVCLASQECTWKSHMCARPRFRREEVNQTAGQPLRLPRHQEPLLPIRAHFSFISQSQQACCDLPPEIITVTYLSRPPWGGGGLPSGRPTFGPPLPSQLRARGHTVPPPTGRVRT